MENESDLAYAGERRTERGSYDVLLDPVHGSAMPQGYTVYFIPDNPEELAEPEPVVHVVRERATQERVFQESTAPVIEAPEPEPEDTPENDYSFTDVAEPVITAELVTTAEPVITAEPVPTPEPVITAEPVPTPEPELPAWMLTTGWTPPQPPIDAPLAVPVPEPSEPEPIVVEPEPEPAEPEPIVAEPVSIEPQPVVPEPVRTPEPAPLTKPVPVTPLVVEPAPQVDRPRRSQHRKPDAAPTRSRSTPSPRPPKSPAVEPPTVVTVVAEPELRSKHAQPNPPTVRRRITTVRLAALGALVVVIAGVYVVSRPSDESGTTGARASSYSGGPVTTTVPTVPVPLSNPEITGSVVYNDGSTLVIVQAGLNEMTVETDASTRVVGTDETVAELAVGQEILVQGIRTMAGTYLAQTITMQQ
ncbi:hypothetical protein GCM10007304_38880 [Rhodococcoides trifolii]|uniref:DUF5666 domain-containing protein n=1 Tax=Rhodococcoides trifolii TaxID=908250 RepID=A0A917LGP0_9NOCA|nr:DUF5666 domain-containing protein [Rhodococcus trifolii]GGG21265.1 hypothetical protein GCM10007304_38880 [Rhodococcus trifolii]